MRARCCRVLSMKCFEGSPHHSSCAAASHLWLCPLSLHAIEVCAACVMQYRCVDGCMEHGWLVLSQEYDLCHDLHRLCMHMFMQNCMHVLISSLCTWREEDPISQGSGALPAQRDARLKKYCIAGQWLLIQSTWRKTIARGAPTRDPWLRLTSLDGVIFFSVACVQSASLAHTPLCTRSGIPVALGWPPAQMTPLPRYGA